MKWLKAIVVVLLLALASLASALPIPPFAHVDELASVMGAAALLAGLLHLAAFHRWSFVRIATLLISIVLARVVAEATWELAPTTVFFVVAGWVHTDGEGAYNAAAYQVFLILSLLAAVAIAFCWPGGPMAERDRVDPP